MKKNLFPFKLEANFIADIDCLLKFLRQPLPLDEFFKKFLIDILIARLDQLEFKLENHRSTEYFVIKFKDNHKTNTIKLTNNDLSCLGITVTDHAHLTNPLIDLQKTSPTSKLKDALTDLITINNNKIKQVTIKSFINFKNSTTINHPDNKNKQAEINLFFIFLNELIAQEINSPDEVSIQSKTLIELTRIKLASADIINWFISNNKKNIFELGNYYSKKYIEINNLINKLYSFKDTTFLAEQLTELNDGHLQQLLNLDPNGSLFSYKKGIETIENFQSIVPKVIEEFQESNLLSLKQLNILHKILNTIAKLMPSFIVQKKTRIGFFRQYTPQNKILLEIEKAIQPFQSNC